MRGLVASILGLGLAANGLTMLAVPVNWYAMVPGVADTGPFNPHFVRDIGVAYVVADAGRRRVSGAPCGGPRLRRRDRARARAPIGVRRPNRLFAAGSDALDRRSPFTPRYKAAKEKSDDQMVSAAVDRQVRTHVEL